MRYIGPMKLFILLLLTAFMGCSTSQSVKTPIVKFDSADHCNRYQTCRENMYGQKSTAEMGMCVTDVTEGYKKLGTLQKEMLNAFYTDCKEFEGCGYAACMVGYTQVKAQARMVDLQEKKALKQKSQEQPNITPN